LEYVIELSEDKHSMIQLAAACGIGDWLYKVVAEGKPLSSELEKNSKKLEKDFGELDCIDRAELLKAMDTWDKFGYTAQYGLERLDKDDKGFVPYVKYDNMVNCVKGMPSVTPQPRKGHWIKGYAFPDGEYWECDKCNELIKVKYPMHYCNNCGSDNREVKE